VSSNLLSPNGLYLTRHNLTNTDTNAGGDQND